MAGGIGTKEIKTKYPYTDGIIAETTNQKGHKMNLVPINGSNYPKRLMVGI